MNCNDINQLNPIELLEKFGIKPTHIKGDEYLYHSPFRVDKTASLSINAAKRLWIDFGSGLKGKNVELLMSLYKAQSVSDMLFQFNKQFNSQSFSFSQLKKKRPQLDSPKTKILKVDQIESGTLIRYLKKRGISKKTWALYVSEITYKNTNGIGKGIGFKNNSNGYEVRTENRKFCLGKKDLTTIHGNPEKVVLFEGFMDFLSFVELGLLDNHTAVVLNSTVLTSRFLELAIEHFTNATIEAYLDNDLAGNKALEEIKEHIPTIINRSIEYKQFKDLNELLMKQMNISKAFIQ